VTLLYCLKLGVQHTVEAIFHVFQQSNLTQFQPDFFVLTVRSAEGRKLVKVARRKIRRASNCLHGDREIGALGKRLRGRDSAIGVVLAFSVGLGSYFLTLYKGNASGAFGLLFGEILGISMRDVWVIAVAGAITLVALAALYRPLVFSSLDEDVAEARGVPTRALSRPSTARSRAGRSMAPGAT